MVNIKCDFIVPSKIGEANTLTLELERIGNSSITLATAAHLDTQKRLAAQLTLCASSFETQRAARPVITDHGLHRANAEDRTFLATGNECNGAKGH